MPHPRCSTSLSGICKFLIKDLTEVWSCHCAYTARPQLLVRSIYLICFVQKHHLMVEHKSTPTTDKITLRNKTYKVLVLTTP